MNDRNGDELWAPGVQAAGGHEDDSGQVKVELYRRPDGVTYLRVSLRSVTRPAYWSHQVVPVNNDLMHLAYEVSVAADRLAAYQGAMYGDSHDSASVVAAAERGYRKMLARLRG